MDIIVVVDILLSDTFSIYILGSSRAVTLASPGVEDSSRSTLGGRADTRAAGPTEYLWSKAEKWFAAQALPKWNEAATSIGGLTLPDGENVEFPVTE